jgi:hypothetical protein
MSQRNVSRRVINDKACGLSTKMNCDTKFGVVTRLDRVTQYAAASRLECE